MEKGVDRSVTVGDFRAFGYRREGVATTEGMDLER
jgi:hypothetical protein